MYINNIVLIKKQVGEDSVLDFEGFKRLFLSMFEEHAKGSVVTFTTKSLAFDLEIDFLSICLYVEEPVYIVQQKSFRGWRFMGEGEGQLRALRIEN